MTNNMNKAQQATLDEFVSYVTRWGKEVKKLETEKLEGCSTVIVLVSVGDQDDEGTIKEIWRTTYCFCIGARGGIFQYGNGSKRVYRTKYTVEAV